MTALSPRIFGLLLPLCGLGACKGDPEKVSGGGATDDDPAPVDSPIFGVNETARYTVDGLVCPVHVLRTEGHVPHLYAADRNDLATGMGFVFAADRFFFLDLARRLALGEVSEFLGQDALETDIDARSSGMTHVADTLLAHLTEEQATHMDAYAAGVNAYITAVADGVLPPPSELELAGPLLGAEQPTDLMAPFTRRHLAGALASLVYELGYETGDVGNARKAAELAAGLYALDAPLAEYREAGALHDVYARLAPVYNDVSAPGFDGGFAGTPATLPMPPAVPLGVLRRLETRLGALERRLGHRDDVGWGSNAWAVMGGASADGRALLASDGHLPLTVPSLFWQVGLDTEALGAGDTTQLGLALPGFPYMAVGTNGRVAWSQTQLGGDITDWYAEELVLDGDGRPDATQFGGESRPLTAIEEQVVVADVPLLGSTGRTETFERYVTADGRFLVDMEGEVVDAGSDPAAVRMGNRFIVASDQDGDGVISAVSFDYTGLDPSGIVSTLDEWGHADTVAEIHTAARGLVAYSQNILAADRSGSIFYTGFQAVPCRDYLDRNADGTWADGADPTMLIDGTRYGSFTVVLDSEQKVDDTRTTDPERCMVPHAEYPFAIDPEQGWLSSANNDPAGHSLDDILENDDWYIGGPWNDGARQHRITERLTELAGSADLESMAELQGDHHSPFGQYLAPHMVETLAEVRAWSESDGATTEAERRAVELYRTDAVRFLEVEERLLMWMNRGFMARSGVVTSYHTPAEDDGRDAVATTIFNAWKGWLVHRALDDEAIGRVWRTSGNTSRLRTLGLMFEGRGADNPSGLASWNPATEESAYWDVLDSEVIETSHEVVLASLLDALELLESEPTGPGEGGFGTSDMDQWLWGLRHTVRFDSVLSEFLGDSGSFSILTDQFSITPDVIPLAEGLTPDDPRYGLEGFPRPGDTESVDAANFGFNRDRFTYGSGPVFRMVFALGPDGVDGLNILPGGQSALTDSPYFADQAAAWLGNDAWPLRFTVAEVVAGATGREVLLPASGETCGQQFE